ncbi:hypothetical protein TeGR_g8687, partial [Tetraparma gracilis]
RLSLELEYVSSLVKSGDWSALRNFLRSRPGSYAAQVCKRAPGRKLPGELEDLSATLVALEDFALSARAIFFNEEDKRQVEMLVEEVGFDNSADLEEARGLFEEVMKTFDSL